MSGLNITSPKTDAHWYTLEGLPRHDATLREARKEGLLPSVTTKLRILDKPMLNAWKVNQAILSALTIERRQDEEMSDFAKRIAEESELEGKEAASLGTQIHAVAEDYLTTGRQSDVPGLTRSCDSLISEILSLDLVSMESETTVVDKERLYAGRIDIRGIARDGKMVIADIKSQNVRPGGKVNFYDEWAYQLAAYAMTPNARIVSIVVSSNKDNQFAKSKEWSAADTQWAWDCWLLINSLWNRKNDFHLPEKGE